jgi:ATP-binding cassette, subfamily F, member 3
MSLLSAQDISFSYGREPILAGASLNLQPGGKYALVGANGTGKSTLLSILSGDLSPHEGALEKAGGVSVYFLRQETTIAAAGDEAIYDLVAEASFARELQIEKELARVNEQLIQDPDSASGHSEKQAALQLEFERLDGYSWRARLEAALTGLGLKPETWHRSAETLSGGQRRRAALAAALLSHCSVLLLDEPTNHLDLKARDWLEDRIERLSAAVVIVSHDRYFLDRATSRTLHLTGGGINAYTGNYSFYLRASAERRERDETAWRRQREKIEKTEAFIRKNLAGQKTKQAQSRRKQLAREEVRERPSEETQGHRINLEAGRSSGAVVIEARSVGKSYDDVALVKDFSMLVTRGQRLGIIGPNGCGKSTLLKMLAGELFPDTGLVTWGHNVDLGHYNQQLSQVSDSNTVLEEIASVWTGATLGQLRSLAGAFGFGADMIDRPVGRLSGGERARLSLLRLVREGHNTLLMDEPTNHLDTGSCETLEDALRQYDGTLIVISHDRRFLDRVVDTLLVFDEKHDAETRPRVFVGNYSAYQQDLKQRQADEAQREGARSSSTAGQRAEEKTGLSKNEIQRRRKRIEVLEDMITKLEDERSQALQDVSREGLTPQQRLEASEKISELDASLADVLKEWEDLNDEIDTIQS